MSPQTEMETTLTDEQIPRHTRTKRPRGVPLNTSRPPHQVGSPRDQRTPNCRIRHGGFPCTSLDSGCRRSTNQVLETYLYPFFYVSFVMVIVSLSDDTNVKWKVFLRTAGEWRVGGPLLDDLTSGGGIPLATPTRACP